MKIGLDFDNTIVRYDNVFHAVALEWGMIESAVPKCKLAVRDFIRKMGNEDRWTEMQGYVYGMCMQSAEMYEGLLQFIQGAKEHEIFIISHKTKYPFLGPRYDLHAAARQWIQENVQLEMQNVFFEETKEKKLERIDLLKCDVFVDDLPEIIFSPNFPKNTRPILFDPNKMHGPSESTFSSWGSIQTALGLR